MSTITAISSVEVFPEAGLDGTGLRPVRCAGCVQRDRSFLDAAAAHEVPADVVDHFVAVDARVIVRHRNRQRVIVEKARYERAERGARRLEGRVHRWGLVKLAGDR